MGLLWNMLVSILLAHQYMILVVISLNLDEFFFKRAY